MAQVSGDVLTDPFNPQEDVKQELQCEVNNEFHENMEENNPGILLDETCEEEWSDSLSLIKKEAAPDGMETVESAEYFMLSVDGIKKEITENEDTDGDDEEKWETINQPVDEIAGEGSTNLLKEEEIILKDEAEQNSETPNPTVFKCCHCKYRTSSESDLISHNFLHADPEKCTLCNYQTSEKYLLKGHLLGHEQMKKFKCTHCNYQTTQKPYLAKHCLVHKKPDEIIRYKCDQCNYQATRKKWLANHYLLHKKPEEAIMYRCDQCDFKAIRKQYLTRHLFVHKNQNADMHKCDKCNFQTVWKSSLTKHYNFHKNSEEAIIYKCERCNYRTVFKQNLMKHYQSIYHQANGLHTTSSCT